MIAIGIAYNAKLQALVKAVKRDIDEQIMPVVKRTAHEYVTDAAFIADGWATDINTAINRLIAQWVSKLGADAIAREFVRSASSYSGRKMRKSFGVNLYNQPNLTEYLEAAANQNIKLIQSIPMQYLDQVNNIVVTNMRTGNRPSAIEKQLQEQFGVTQRRAKMIARDQTAKITSEISEKRQRAAGFEYFQWVTSKDQRVRDRHHEIANTVTKYGKGIYRWDDLPKSDKGVPISCGSDYQCRCIAIAIDNEEVENNIKKGKTNPKHKI